jgi:F-type H+-transporting ATPase subunit delta
MAKLISKTYGEALFELAVDGNKTDVFMEEIQGIIEILGENKDFSVLLNHPKVAKEEKIKIVENVFKGRISEELVGFLILVISKSRYSEINAILHYFLGKIKGFKGIGIAYVTTAISLKDEQKKEIEKKLIQTTSFNKMEMHFREDKEIIGGMIIRIGDRVVDSSIRSKLSKLEKQLLKIQLTN